VKRRDFIATLGGAAAWPLIARAQRPATPVVGFINSSRADAFASNMTAFRNGLAETGNVDGAVHIIFENFENISPELEDHIRETLLAALANIPGVRLGDVDGLSAEAASNNSH
jgi:putative ABC transport system substrate-binding protein